MMSSCTLGTNDCSCKYDSRNVAWILPSAVGKHTPPIVNSLTVPAVLDMKHQAVMVCMNVFLTMLSKASIDFTASIFQLYVGDLHPVQMEVPVQQ